MDDPSGDWEIVNYPSLEEDVEITEKSSSKLEWIVNTGLSLGKKVAITGFVITSVPVMLPPLAVVSALGIASSVPFGLVFASYACTERLMSKLLPHSPSQINLDYDDYATLNEDEKNEAYTIPIDDDVFTEQTPDNVDEIPQRKDVEFLDTVGKNSGGADDNRTDINGTDGNETKEGDVDEKTDKSIAAAEGHEKHQSVSKGKSNSLKKKKKSTKRLGLSEKEPPVKNKDTDSLQEVKKTPVEKSKERDLVKENQNLPEKTVEGSSEQGKVNARDHDAIVASDENRERELEKQQQKAVSEDRDEVWREIDAIRVIVGVKTPRNASIFEELKELYLFTGVEPPSSDFSDFQNKLAFLKSVIGLK